MTKPNLKNMPVEALVALFRQYALEQDDAMLSGEQARINRLGRRLITAQPDANGNEL